MRCRTSILLVCRRHAREAAQRTSWKLVQLTKKRPARQLPNRPLLDTPESLLESAPAENQLVQVVEKSSQRIKDAFEWTNGIDVATLNCATGLQQVDLRRHRLQLRIAHLRQARIDLRAAHAEMGELSRNDLLAEV